MSTPAIFFDVPAGESEPVFHFNSYIDPEKVDRARGVVRDVTVITAGVEAAGHGLHTDQTTLEQMESCGQTLGQVPVKWNHKTGADAVCGYICNFRRDGNKLLGDWHLLKNHDRFSQALELAERMPGCVGLSAAFKGTPTTAADGKRFARCREMLAVDLVAHPAANPDGLFEAKVDTPGSTIMDADQTTTDETTLLSQLGEMLDQRLAPLTERLAELEEFNEAVTEELNHFDEEDELVAPEVDSAEFVEDVAEGADLSREDIVNDVIGYFADRQEEHDEESAFSALQSKVGELTELAEATLAENEALRTAAAGVGKPVSAAGEATMFGTTDSLDGVTEFERQVQGYRADGKRPGEATNLAMKADPAAYQAHLQAKGILAS